jgi:uncharacterized protein (DUF362 family)
LLSTAGFTLEKYDLVLVKPNICGMYHPSPQLIISTLKIFEPISNRIVIGETNSTIHDPEREFQRLGIYEILEHFDGKVEALNLIHDEPLRIKVPSPHVEKYLPIPKTVHRCDLLVNIPKIGTHSNTKLTCALKNLFGLLAEKRKYSVYHPQGMDNVIADIAKVVRCDLNIVDAQNKVLVGVDPLTVDIHACEYVGLDPTDVKHLRLVSEDRGLTLPDLVSQLDLVKA